MANIAIKRFMQWPAPCAAGFSTDCQVAHGGRLSELNEKPLVNNNIIYMTLREETTDYAEDAALTGIESSTKD